MTAVLQNPKQCTECGSTNLVTDHQTGELICTECGTVVVDNLIDQGPEWRAFNLDQYDKLNRVGAPLTLTIHDRGLSTTIGWQNQDATGRKMSPEEQERQYRLRKWQRRTSSNDSAQRNDR